MQGVCTAYGAAAVELAQAKEQARVSNVAALKAAEELRGRTGCSSPKRGKDSRNGWGVKKCHRPVCTP